MPEVPRRLKLDTFGVWVVIRGLVPVSPWLIAWLVTHEAG